MKNVNVSKMLTPQKKKTMPAQCIILLYLLTFTSALISAEKGDVAFGMHIMFGGRYDTMRMCVASPAGAKGGIIADIMFDTRYYIKDNVTVVFNLPVMRPILFAAAFRMLQFEPQVAIEFSNTMNDKADFIVSPGLGLSLHYGPDYNSDKNNRGDSFFAAGPYISSLFGVGFRGSSEKQKIIGLRAFYIPLFSKDHGIGTVLGGALEGHFSFQ